MQQATRDYLVHLFSRSSDDGGELVALLEQSVERAEIVTFMAGWYACLKHFEETKQNAEIAPEVDAFLRKLEPRRETTDGETITEHAQREGVLGRACGVVFGDFEKPGVAAAVHRDPSCWHR